MAECTGVAARWCPIHGDCTDRGGKKDGHCDDPQCPLHGVNSQHAASVPPEPPTLSELYSCPRCGGTEITSQSAIAGRCQGCGWSGFFGEPGSPSVPPEPPTLSGANQWACGHIKPGTLGDGSSLVGGKYVVSCELRRGHEGDHERYGSHWLNNGTNRTDHAPTANESVPPEPPTLSDEIRSLLRVSLDTGKVEVSEVMAVSTLVAALRAEAREAQDQRDEYRTERDQAADEVRTLRAEVAAAKAVIEAARQMPRDTPAPGGTSTVHQFKLSAADVWALDRALTAYDRAARSASGEDRSNG